MEPVRSRQNRKVVEAARLLRERSENRAVLQGTTLILEAAANGVELARLFVLESTESLAVDALDVVVVTEPVMERLTPTSGAWGPVAIARIDPRPPRVDRPVLLAHRISDPGNLGTMIRSAAAFGYDVVAVDGADPWSHKTLRAGAGSHFHTHVSTATALPDRPLVAAVAANGVRLRECNPPARHALAVGSEAHGLPEELVAAAAHRVTIETGDVESLNAAVAASILMHALAKAGGSDTPQD